MSKKDKNEKTPELVLDPEKADVDISRLFEWVREVVLKTSSDEPMTVWMRIPTDASMNRARVAATRASAELRENLFNPEWEEREVYIKDVSHLTDDELVSLITSYSIRELGDALLPEIHKEVPYPKEPAGDADLEEQEKYQKDVDTYQERFGAAFKAVLEVRVDKMRKSLLKKSRKENNRTYEIDLIRELCNAKFLDHFREMCVVLSTYLDKDMTKLMFKDYEDFYNKPKFLKDQLMEAYGLLEISSITLKK